MIKAGDRIEWDKQAHLHTKQMNIESTGIIDRMLPFGQAHIDNTVDECEMDKVAIFFIKVDGSNARIGLTSGFGDLRFPDGVDEVEPEEDLDDWEDDLFD
jgi:hypothetical protein